MLFEDQILFEEDKELDKGEPSKFLAWVKLKLSLDSFSVMGEVLWYHLIWFAKDRFSEIEESYDLFNL
jgi:hypothetical protein